MNLFLPDSGLVIWMLLAFSIVFFVLAKFAWPTILSSLKQREDHITTSLKKAEEAAQSLAGLEEKGKAIIAAAQAEQMRMVKETKQMNEKMVAEAKLQAKQEAQQIIDDARAQIAKEKAQAIAEIRSEVATLSIGMAEKILRQELADKKAQEQYIERLLKENVSAS